HAHRRDSLWWGPAFRSGPTGGASGIPLAGGLSLQSGGSLPPRHCGGLGSTRVSGAGGNPIRYSLRTSSLVSSPRPSHSPLHAALPDKRDGSALSDGWCSSRWWLSLWRSQLPYSLDASSTTSATRAGSVVAAA